MQAGRKHLLTLDAPEPQGGDNDDAHTSCYASEIIKDAINKDGDDMFMLRLYFYLSYVLAFYSR